MTVEATEQVAWVNKTAASSNVDECFFSCRAENFSLVQSPTNQIVDWALANNGEEVSIKRAWVFAGDRVS